jgi:hypothetical protein
MQHTKIKNVIKLSSSLLSSFSSSSHHVTELLSMSRGYIPVSESHWVYIIAY